MNREVIVSFIAIVQQQTISAAAKTLFVSQSTISHRIQMLEQELGIVLFERNRGFKKMELTNDGKKFYPLAMQWLDLNTQMHEIHTSSSLGRVQIGSMDSINQYLLPPIISKIREDVPDLQLEFVSYHSQEIYTRLTSQLMDIGFAFYPIRYDILATPVFSEPVYMICLPGFYPQGEIHPSQLKKRDEVFFTWDDNISRWNHEWWDEHDPPYVKVDSCGLLKTFLSSPQRWALCPASVAFSLRESHGIDIHEFSVSPPNRVCYLLRRKHPAGSPLHRGLDAFIEAFYNIAKDNPWYYHASK